MSSNLELILLAYPTV